MNILYCGDKNIADGTLLSVLSLMEYSSEPLSIYLLTASLKTENKVYLPLTYEFAYKLERKVKEKDPESSVTLIDATELFSRNLPAANLDTRFTPFCMLRLFADKIPSLPERILYLDNDVICRKDFSEFYYQDIENYELAGVLDYYGKHFFRKNPLKFDYINSGVLLLNLKKIRETGLFRSCRRICKTKKMFMPDQSAINKLCTAKKLCSGKYNEQRKLRKDTVFHHFTTSFRFFPVFRKVSVKPWQIDKVRSVLKIHEYDALFSSYLAIKSN